MLADDAARTCASANAADRARAQQLSQSSSTGAVQRQLGQRPKAQRRPGAFGRRRRLAGHPAALTVHGTCGAAGVSSRAPAGGKSVWYLQAHLKACTPLREGGDQHRQRGRQGHLQHPSPGSTPHRQSEHSVQGADRRQGDTPHHHGAHRGQGVCTELRAAVRCAAKAEALEKSPPPTCAPGHPLPPTRAHRHPSPPSPLGSPAQDTRPAKPRTWAARLPVAQACSRRSASRQTLQLSAGVFLLRKSARISARPACSAATSSGT